MPNTETMDRPVRADRNASGEPRTKRRRGERGPLTEVDRSPPTDVSLDDLGGVDSVIEELNEAVGLPMLYPDKYLRTGIQPPRGVLLHGKHRHCLKLPIYSEILNS